VGQVFRLQRERTIKGQHSVEVVYGWTSLSPQQCSPQRLLQLIRAHWAVENRLHWRRDVTLGEDRCGVRFPPVAQMLAVLNTVVLSLMDFHRVANVARQIRHFASHPDEALDWALDFCGRGGNTSVQSQMVNSRRTCSKEKEQGEPMRKKKRYAQAVKRIMRPEITHCLECQRKLQRCVTISDRMIITLKQVIRLVHCGYRCPHPDCSGRKTLYRSAEADALALAGLTFGWDIVLFVGQRRLREHQTVDEIHQSLLEQLTPLDQTISRREILFLFEAYSALLRAGTEVTHDEGGKEQVRKNKGIVLSIDGIQKD
jgi:hypothetical protein